jgi:hypothetical protein
VPGDAGGEGTQMRAPLQVFRSMTSSLLATRIGSVYSSSAVEGFPGQNGRVTDVIPVEFC